MLKTQQQIENCLHGDLSNCLTELEMGQLTREGMLGYFSSFLLHANVDSRIAVNVLEQFGKDGKEQALSIKVNEGW